MTKTHSYDVCIVGASTMWSGWRTFTRGDRSSTNEGNAMKKQAHNPVNPKLSESDETASKPTGAVSGEFVTETFEYDGGRQVTESWFGVALPAERTAVFGASAGGELALALGLRHPHVYGAVFCASPGGGYKPPDVMPSPLPRTYLVAGTEEPFFLANARRWADALRDAGADVVMNERAGSHGGAFWREEFQLMVAWAFGHDASSSTHS
jgi:hypothetical protein